MDMIATSAEKEKHILLAEDDDEDFMVFEMALREVKLEVLLSRAENGDILIKLLDQNVPDILFLDIHMPCRDGHQCLREIRANKRYDELPVIIYSSLKDLVNIDVCYREGANLYTIKPGSFAELKTILQKILSIDWKKFLYFPPKSEFVMNAQ